MQDRRRGAQGGTREGSRVCRAAAGAAGTHPRTALGVLVALGPVPRAVRLAHGVGRSGGGRSQRGPQQAGEQPSSVGSPADTLYDPVKPLGLHGSHLPACARLLRRWRLGQRGAVAIVNGESDGPTIHAPVTPRRLRGLQHGLNGAEERIVV
jgi:hypothetical protein